MDKLDERIVAILRENAREPYVNIAKILDTSEGTIRARVKRLLAEGTIRKFTLRTAGKGVKALVEVRVRTNVNTSDISTKIAGWDGVEQVWEVSGDNDIVVLVDAPGTEALNDVVERIRGMAETAGTESRLVLKEL